jgi:hypothetical protein
MHHSSDHYSDHALTTFPYCHGFPHFFPGEVASVPKLLVPDPLRQPPPLRDRKEEEGHPADNELDVIVVVVGGKELTSLARLLCGTFHRRRTPSRETVAAIVAKISAAVIWSSLNASYELNVLEGRHSRRSAPRNYEFRLFRHGHF